MGWKIRKKEGRGSTGMEGEGKTLKESRKGDGRGRERKKGRKGEGKVILPTMKSCIRHWSPVTVDHCLEYLNVTMSFNKRSTAANRLR